MGSVILLSFAFLAASPEQHFYRPRRGVPPTLEPFLSQVSPGQDAFPEEKEAEELGRRLQELGAALRQSPGRSGEAAQRLLAPDFKGSRLVPAEETAVRQGPPLEVFRAKSLSADPTLDARAFVAELPALVEGWERVEVAEFLITAITVERTATPQARTDVRYDLVGSGAGGRGQRLGRWRLQWRRGSGGAWQVHEWVALDHTRSRALAPIFTEVTPAALGANPSFARQLATGLDDWLATLDSVFALDTMGHHGVSAGDADGDGLDDLYLAQPSGLPNRLFRNKGDGTFEDVTEGAGLSVLDDTSQSLFADVDNDGDQDLVLVARTGPLLFANDGKGRFRPVDGAFRVKGTLQGSPIAMAMADYDRDGFLDLYLCTYSYFIGAGEDKAGSPNPYHDAQNGPPDVLFRNDGRGRFVDVTEEVGLKENNDRFSFAAAWADYDEDGWPDLFVANDFGRKNLFHNEGLKYGKVRFKDVAGAAGAEDHGAGMSAAWLDYDHDGHLDIYAGNMWTAAGQRVTAAPGFMPEAPAEVRDLYRRHARGNTLLRNRGDGRFEDVTIPARAEMGRWAWSSDALDFDLDGWEDLFVVNGMFTRQGADLDSFFWRQVTARSPLSRVTGTPYEDAWRAINRLLVADGSQAPHERDVFLRGDGQGGFDEVGGSLGLDLDQDGRSFAVLDYDLDGDPDLAVAAARSAPQLRFFRNDFAQENASLAVRLVGGKSNRDAIGARVAVETDAGRLTKIVQAGSGFISQHSKELIFGLGKSPSARKLTIVWPSGLTQSFTDLPAGQRFRIEEGGTPQAAPFHRAAPSAAGTLVATPVPPPSASWLYEPYPAPDFTLFDLEGRKRSLTALRGKPALLLLWSAAAAPSREALQELARQQAAFTRAGASVLAMALDPAEDAAKVRAAARGPTGFPVVLASEEVGATYAILNQYLFVRKEPLRLPTLLLLNPRGEVVKAYRDRIAAAEVLADLPKIEAAPAARLARAVPFAGAFQSAPAQRQYLQYGLELVEQGLEGAALPAFETAAKGDPSAFTLYSLGTLYMKSGQPAKAQAAFERALQVKADFAEASNGLGALLAQGGDLSGAVARFRMALDATPDYPDAMNNLGYALLQAGRRDEAFDLYQRALKLQPDFPEAFNNLGIYFAGDGDMARAESYFKQALEKRPGYGEAGNNFALVLMARDDAPTAVAVLQRLLEVNPDFEMTYVTLAKIYLSTARRREAVQLLERLLQKSPQHPLGLQLMREAGGGR
jgi:tetratricopeptide (TPR) repeat protein